MSRSFPLALLLCLHGVDCIASGAQSNQTAPGLPREMLYTQNSLCRTNYCTNPIFPGINDLPRLEALQWQCSTSSAVSQYMDFCKDAVNYDPALPSPVKEATAITELVSAQDDAAMTMFAYHISGMGYELWDYQEPSKSDNECIRSVWKMVCFTYFPRAEAGCKAGQQSFYKRPCKSCCQNYIQHCGVECCDESVQCVFAHTSTTKTGQTQLLQTGYVDELGPSAMCTGSAKRSISSPLGVLLAIFGMHWATTGIFTSEHSGSASSGTRRRTGRSLKSALVCLTIVAAVSLQGCAVDIPKHVVGNWRTKENYLTEYSFVPPGGNRQSAALNSCNNASLPTSLQCNGRGFCKAFTKNAVAVQQSKRPVLSFCQCERDWADPECGTKRKSQITTFFWSIFLGFLGADYFYLGFPLWGLGKLCTLGGLGFWWLLDIVRTGAGPVYAYNFRVANDLPHWVAILLMIFLCMFCGFATALWNFLLVRRKRRADVLQLLGKEEARDFNQYSVEELRGCEGPRFRYNLKGQPHHNIDFEGRPEFSGYGAALPVPHHNARAPYAGDAPGNFGPAGVPGQGSPTPAGSGFAPLHMPYDGPQPHRAKDNLLRGQPV